MGAKDQRNRRDRLEAATAERLAEIVAAAERAATQVIDDAEREAQPPDRGGARPGRGADRRADRDADRRGRRADRAGERDPPPLQELLASLSRLRTELEPAQPAGPELRPTPEGWTGYGPKIAPRGSHLSAVAPAPEPDSAPQPEAQEPSPPSGAGARLLATQMAISGASRQEIAARLRNGFEIDDPEAILEAILGPEG